MKCIHSLSSYLLKTYYVPSSLLGARDRPVNRTKEMSASHEVDIVVVGDRQRTKYMQVTAHVGK